MRRPIGPGAFTSVTRAQGYELTEDGRFFYRDARGEFSEVPKETVPQAAKQEIIDQCGDPVLRQKYQDLLFGKKSGTIRGMLNKLFGKK